MFAARILCCLALALVGLAPATHAADEAAIQALLRKEGLGALHLDQSEREVIKLLGKPEKEGKLTRQEADATYVQQWEFPSKGLSLLMSAGPKKNGARTIAAITARAPCPFATQRGIKIGDAESAPRKAYAAVADRESPAERGAFVAGSIYGGIIFNFEHGKVSRIFIGAGAE